MTTLINQTIKAGMVFTATLIIMFIAKLLLNRLADRFDRNQQALLDDVLRSLRVPVISLILLGGVYQSLYQISRLQPALEKGGKFFNAGATLIIIIAASNAVALGLTWYSRRMSNASEHSGPLGLFRKLSMLVVWALGIIQILAQLGQPLGPLLASLGIASLAVGLALQDTIANLFAGFYIVADRTVRPGDYVKLDEKTEGFVETVGWRNTTIKLWANNLVLVPNAQLVKSVITNMTLPNPALSIYTRCGVSYESDLEEVERVTLEVADDIIHNHPGADLSFNPVVRFKEFGESNINFVVVFRAVEVGEQYRLQHEFIKALHRRFKEEGIEISYPVRKLIGDGSTFPTEVLAVSREQ